MSPGRGRGHSPQPWEQAPFPSVRGMQSSETHGEGALQGYPRGLIPEGLLTWGESPVLLAPPGYLAQVCRPDVPWRTFPASLAALGVEPGSGGGI